MDDGPYAAAELATELRTAWERAGKPSMTYVGDQVGYSKATISKVLSGKMPPAWQLIRKLGPVLNVPQSTVNDHWHPLWVAADRYRTAAPGTVREQTPHGFECHGCG